MKIEYTETISPPAQNTNDSLTMIATAKKFLSADECKQLIMLSEQASLDDGTIGKTKDLSVMRKSKVTCLLPDPNTNWIFERLEAAIAQMNKAYKYKLQGFYEGVQIAEYSKDGKYDWHMDIGPGANSRRKLSMSIQLTEQADYSDGNLEFMNNEQETEREIGALIVFPSFLQHRVTSVTDGTRHSLVAWVHGTPFS